MHNLKIAVQTASFGQPLRKALHTAAAMGASGVEIDARQELTPGSLTRTGLRQFLNLTNELNLRVASVSFRTRGGYDVTERLEERVDATKAAMRLAESLRCPLVVNQAASNPLETETVDSGLIAVLTDLANYGMRNGVTLAARTQRRSPKELAALLGALPDGFMGANIDPAELIAHGHSPVAAIGLLGPWIRHFHASDAVIDPKTDSARDVQLGRGSADYAEILAALEEYGYGGFFTTTCRGASDPTTAIAQSLKYLARLRQ